MAGLCVKLLPKWESTLLSLFVFAVIAVRNGNYGECYLHLPLGDWIWFFDNLEDLYFVGIDVWDHLSLQLGGSIWGHNMMKLALWLLRWHNYTEFWGVSRGKSSPALQPFFRSTPALQHFLFQYSSPQTHTSAPHFTVLHSQKWFLSWVLTLQVIWDQGSSAPTYFSIHQCSDLLSSATTLALQSNFPQRSSAPITFSAML